MNGKYISSLCAWLNGKPTTRETMDPHMSAVSFLLHVYGLVVYTNGWQIYEGKGILMTMYGTFLW